jgi:predicted nucleic acid-binding protein
MDFIEKNKETFDIYINPSVWADVIYMVNKKHGIDLKVIGYYLFLNFKILDITQKLAFYSFSFIQKYKLNPSEAMVLACCKEYDIKHLLSLNNDFIKPAEGEGIIHINALGKLKALQENCKDRNA